MASSSSDEVYGSTVIDSDDAQAMKLYGLALPPSSSGTLRVSKRRLREPPSCEDSAISLGSFSSSSFSSSDEWVDVPLVRDSPAYFQWLGFTEDASNALFYLWNNCPPDSPFSPSTLLDIAKDHVGKLNDDANGLDDPWDEVMVQLGIDSELRRVILDSELTHIRLTASLKYWLLDTFDMRQRALEEIATKSAERTKECQKKKKQTSSTVSAKEVQDIAQ